MIKKIYTLLLILLALTACTTDELINNNGENSNPDKVSISFDVDVPSAAIISKSTTVPINETGIENLQLITFDANNEFIEAVPAIINGAGYSANISKQTRRIQFVSNYDNYKNILTVEDVESLDTDEYTFFAEKTYTGEPSATLGSISLLRNWSKITLEDQSGKLSEIQFMVYNRSNKATISKGSKSINIPKKNTYKKDESMTSGNSPIHTFENVCSGENGAFIIVKAKFNGASNATYYKLDLSTILINGITQNYDIIRNHWFKITISNVSRAGKNWGEITKAGTVADNNITASAVLDKYPSIAFGNESLEVTKTTFVFTESNQLLNMLATYKLNNNLTYNGLSLVDGENLSSVISGSLSSSNESNSMRIKASIKAPSDVEQKATFYVKGGTLQRKITLVLRKPYLFENVHFYNTSDVYASFVEGTTNKIAEGQETDIWFGFTIPDNVDESVFPLECKIKSNTLYAVTDGVRIETLGNGSYYYVYTAQNTGRHRIQFKTNASVTGEDVLLQALYFTDKNASYVTNAPTVVSINGIARYNKNVKWKIDGNMTYSIEGTSVSGTITVNNGSYSVEIPKGLENKNVTFTYQSLFSTYRQTLKVNDWIKNTSLLLE